MANGSVIPQRLGVTSQTGVQIGANATIAGGIGGQTGSQTIAAAGVQVGVTASSTTGILHGVIMYNPAIPYYIPPANINVHVIATHKEFLDPRGLARVSK